MSSKGYPLVCSKLALGKLTLASLAADHHVHATRHKVHPNLVSLKYDQIHADFSSPLVRECRGLILDEAESWRVVARGYDKFFNYGDPLAAIVGFYGATAYDKLDGSLMMMYWYENQWRVASSGTPDASGQVGDHDITFEKLFWKVFIEKGYQVPDSQWTHCTFLFELMTPLNRVVVRHKENKLVLTGVRTIKEGRLYAPSKVTVDYEKCHHTQVTSIESLTETLAKLDPLEHEGYVIIDGYGNMVKLKHPGYVALHHMISTHSAKSALDVIRKGERAEVLIAFPELTPMFNELVAGYCELTRQIAVAWATHRDIADQKEFALAVKDLPHSSALFALKRGKVPDVSTFLKQMRLDMLMRWVRESAAEPKQEPTE